MTPPTCAHNCAEPSRHKEGPELANRESVTVSESERDTHIEEKGRGSPRVRVPVRSPPGGRPSGGSPEPRGAWREGAAPRRPLAQETGTVGQTVMKRRRGQEKK